MRVLTAILFGLSLGACGTEEPGSTKSNDTTTVEPLGCVPFLVPTSVDFGEVEIGDTRAFDLSVGNAGDEDCTVANVELLDGDEAFAVAAWDALVVPPRGLRGDRRGLMFSPTAASAYTGRGGERG